MSPVILQPGSSVSYLTVASVQLQSFVSSSLLVVKAIWIDSKIDRIFFRVFFIQKPYFSPIHLFQFR